MDAAAACGHLDVVKWLHLYRTEGCTTTAMDLAAANGHLEIVKWLHSHRIEGCTTAAMDNSATRHFHAAPCNGSSDIDRDPVLFHEEITGLLSNRCSCIYRTPTYFHEKQLEILKWLLQNRDEGCTTAAMDGAAANGNLITLQWLHENTTPGSTLKAMASAAQLG
ncbi:unnamed protein product [Phytophthora fragariaefolia]|uniref:Unnamed protein product n=1 Tax=Phytophthora fragariaefolia TaxID=1490495 RepID=A0A9W6U5Q0_9STRA|nr:unnamed protein product [Phytophthora fragariaefolia]